ncbi:hypothetical protein KP509_02G009800 [Ceratopteris richardii]|uniref:FAS1 domain-containing protein n=1 Tax=Ceratopteris richardii TaxID=49495 RepID=A0A8T2V3D7_CERRI|nr:hypothetical protein KP509_02G009800 [Ceratopteris richardii]
MSSGGWPWRPSSYAAFFFVATLSCLSREALSSSFLPITTPAMPPSQIILVNLIVLTNHANMPPSSTIFLPLNQSIAMAFPTPLDLDTVSYHVVCSRHLYKDLLSMQKFPGVFPTLLPRGEIRVVRVDQALFVDEQEIVAPDLYFDDNMVVHGIRHALNPDLSITQSSGAATRPWPFPDSGP